MGFASVIQELNTLEGSVLKPLVGFNLGVEVGQVTLFAGAFVLSIWMPGREEFKEVRLDASAMIGLMGLHWTCEHVFP